MRRKLASLAFTAALAAGLATGPAAVAAPASEPHPSIIGGETVESAPWGVQVSSGGAFCSGSIIAPQWVLTAGHCLSNNMRFKVGDVRLGHGVDAVGDATYQHGDTGLVHLTTRVETTYSPLGEADPPVGAVVDIYGWGLTSRSGTTKAPKLKTAKVKVTKFLDTATERRIRAVESTGSAWFGDSGGPMFYNGVQVGTCTGVSLSTNEVIYPSIATARSWIRDTTGV